MNILHVSDLHLSSTFKKDNIIKTRNLLKHFVDNDYDHLVITGDISDNSEEKDWLLLKKMLQLFGIYNSDKVTVIIGNHDIYGGVQTALDILSFPKRCQQADYFAKIKQFVLTFKELHEDVIFSYPNIYPFTKVVGNYALIAVNTIDLYSRYYNPFASNGKVSSTDLDSLSNHLSSPLIINKEKIVLAHHHFYKNNCESTSSYSTIWNKIEKHTMKLRGKKKLIKLFSNNKVKLVLHGHSHEIKQYSRKGITFVNAGGCVDNLIPNLCSIVSIDLSNDNLIVNTEELQITEIISLPKRYNAILNTV